MKTWLILAGGRGSRSENPQTPKILQSVGPVLILDFLLHSLSRGQSKARCVFVLHHGGGQVREAVLSRIPQFHNLEAVFVFDDGDGPVGAIRSAAQGLTDTDFGIVLGDTFIAADLGGFFERFRSSQRDIGVVCRQSDHLYDSDAISIDYLGNVTRFFEKGSAVQIDAGQVWGLSGVLFARSSVIANLNPDLPDVANALIQASGNLEQIFTAKTRMPFRDSGTSERIQSIRDFVKDRTPAEVSLEIPKRAVFLDRDGTLIPDFENGRAHLLPQEVNLNLAEIIREANMFGLPVFLITNQPAVSKGQIAFEDVYRVNNLLQKHLMSIGARIDDVVFCPHHPERGHLGEIPSLKISCLCRKPQTGMVAHLAKIHGITDFEASVLVGDSDRDALTAESVGMKFFDVGNANLSADLRAWIGL